MIKDLLDELAAITTGSALDELRALRPDVRAASAGSEAAIFSGASGLSGAERHGVALHVAALHECAELAEHHRRLAGT